MRIELPEQLPIPPKKHGTILLQLGCIIMLLIGLGLVIRGCGGELNEKESAIRDTMYAVQYGAGFILILLSMILAALIRLIVRE